MSKTDSNKEEATAALNEMLNGKESDETEEEKTVESEKDKTVTEADASEETTDETKDEKTDESASEDSDVDEWKRESRKWEARAKENKEKADKYDEALSKVSTLEKQLNDAKAEAEKASVETKRWMVAAKYGVEEEDVNLFLTASDEETLEKQAQRLSKTSAHAPKPDAAQGKRTSTGPVSTKQQGAAALGELFN